MAASERILFVTAAADVNRRGKSKHTRGNESSRHFSFQSLTNQLCQSKSSFGARGTEQRLFWCLTATHVGSGQAEQSSHAKLDRLQRWNLVDDSRRNSSRVTFFCGLKKLDRECCEKKFFFFTFLLNLWRMRKRWMEAPSPRGGGHFTSWKAACKPTATSQVKLCLALISVVKVLRHWYRGGWRFITTPYLPLHGPLSFLTARVDLK